MFPATAEETAGLARALEREYPGLAPVTAIEPMRVALVSSLIFRVEAGGGAYCAKLPGYTRRIGQTDEDLRAEWTLVLEAQARLLALGVPVEDLLRTRSGDPVFEHRGRLCRVVRFVPSRPFSGSDADLRDAGRALGAFHAAGRVLLASDPALAAGIRHRLVRDMPLAGSLAAWPDLRAGLLRLDPAALPDKAREVAAELAGIRDSLDTRIAPLCRRAEARLRDMPAGPEGLGHFDYHPANVLFRDAAPPLVLDLEQIAVGPLAKCAALGATRFAMAARDADPSRDERAAAAAFVRGWIETFPGGAPAVAQIPDWILLYELEKTLRILRRTLAGDVVPPMVRKIVTHHLPLGERAGSFRI